MVKIKCRIRKNRTYATVKVPKAYIININQYTVFEQNVSKRMFSLLTVMKNSISFAAPAGINLKKRLKDTVTEDEARALDTQITAIVSKAEAAGLQITNFVFDSKYVFINELTGELMLLYLPVVGQNLGWRQDNLTAQINSAICSEKTVCKTKKEWETYAQPLPAKASPDEDIQAIEDDRTDIMGISETPHFIKKAEPREKPLMRIAVPAENDETAVISDEAEEETQYLPSMVSNPVLVRRKTGVVIHINKAAFRVGKDSGSVDYVVEDNPAISRNHADIIVRNGHYYIVDLRSKNRSYINGRVIRSETEEEIKNGDILKLANEEFEFRIS